METNHNTNGDKMSKLFTVPPAARKAIDLEILADVQAVYDEYAELRQRGLPAREPTISPRSIAYTLDRVLVRLCKVASQDTWHDVQFVRPADRARYISTRVASLHRRGLLKRSVGCDRGRDAWFYEPA